MGVVYEAEQESLGRHVALKVLPGHSQLDPKLLARFRREAKAAARLHHTNIVPVFGVGEHEGTPYYVMQFIQGQALDEVLRELRRLRRSKPANQVDPGVSRPGPPAEAREVSAADVAQALMTGQFAEADQVPLGSGVPDASFATAREAAAVTGPPRSPSGLAGESGPTPSWPGRADASSLSGSVRDYWRGVARIGAQAAEALGYAHGQGTLHRDIKPSNLLLDLRGAVWVADFGLAKAADEADLTHTGDIVGTLRYMAPERFRGASDPRSDVYGLGMTLYELLTMRPAFDETDRERLVHQVTQGQPPRPSKLNPEVPRDLETIVLKAIDREQALRYQTAGELAEDLQRYLDDRPIRARRASMAERAWRWCRRNPAVAGLAAAVALLLVTVAFGSTIAAVRLGGMARTERDLRSDADRINDELEASLYTSRIALAHREWLKGNIGVAERYLDECPARLRRWEWHYLKRLSHTALMTLRGHDDYAFCVAYRPDGRHLASASQDGTVRIWDASTGRSLRTLTGHDDIIWAVAYSPDGRYLASGGRDKLVGIWDARDYRLIRTLTGHTQTIRGVAFSPDGAKLVSVARLDTAEGRPGELTIWDVASGRAIRALRPESGALGVAFSLDGKHLASTTVRARPMIEIREASTWEVVRRIPTPPTGLVAVAFSPDGKVLATSGHDAVRLWEVATGRLVHALRGHIGPVNSLAFRRDGKVLATSGHDQTVRLWDVASGREVHTFRGHTERVVGVAFRPDGRHLASASVDRTVKVWDLTHLREAGREAESFDVGPIQSSKRSIAAALAEGPGGWRFATVGEDHRIRLGELGAGGPALTPSGHSDEIWDLVFSPDGTLLASASSDRTERIWDTASGRAVSVLRGHTDWCFGVAFHPGGRLIASTSRDGTIRVWDAREGRELLKEIHPSGLTWLVAYSPDGGHLASAEEESSRRKPLVVRLRDGVTGRPIRTMGGYIDFVPQLVFSPDGSRLAFGEGAMIHLVDVASGRELPTLRGHTNAINRVAFHPDGIRLASAGDDQTVKLWDLATGRELLTLRHDGPVVALAFSRDVRRLASAGGGSVKIWDATPLTDTVPDSEDVPRQAMSAHPSGADRDPLDPETDDESR